VAVIGRFQQKDDGYSGAIATLAFRVNPVRFVKRTKGATFSIHGPDDCELGAAWLKAGEFGDYLSVKLDCPSLAAPVNAIMSLKATEGGSFLLRWQRRENGRDAQ
jgi:uncharacterized protein (DUF736 family)